MKFLKIFMCAAFLMSDIAPLYAEVMFDKPMYQTGSVRPSMRTPQEIIADFQASVDKIQEEQRDLYGEIESKNKENAFLLRKINDLSIKLLQLDYSLSKKAAQNSPALPDQVAKLTEEKDILLKKYNEAISQKLRLESEIKKLNSDQESVEEKVQAGVATLREALNSSEEETAQLKAQMEALLSEKETLETQRRQAFEDKSILQSRIQSMEVQIQEMKNSAAEASMLRQSPLQQRVRELSDRMDAMREDLREKDRMIADAKKKESKSLVDLKKFQQEKDELKIQIQKLTSTYNAAQEGRAAKISRLESMIQEKQKEIDRLTSQSAKKPKIASASDPDRNALEGQILRLKENFEKEQAAYERKLEKSKAPFLLQIQALQKTLEQKSSELSKKNKELELLRSKSKELSKKVEATRSEKESLNKTIQNLEKKTNSSENEKTGTEEALGAKILSLQQELDKREDQLQEESERVDALEAQKKELSLAVEKMSRDKESLQKQLASFKEKASDEKVQPQDNTDDVRQEYEQKMSFLSAEIKELEEKLKDKEKKIEDQVKEANRQKEDLQSTIASLENELEKKGVGASIETEAKTQPVDQKDAIKKLTTEKQKLEKDLKETLSQRGQLEEEVATLKIKYEAMEADMSEKMRQARAPLEEAMTKLKAQLAEQMKISEDKDRSVEDLKEQVQAREKVLKINSEEKEDLKQKVSYLEGLLENSKNEITKVAGQQSLVLDKKTEELNNELKQANKALEDKNALINELKNKNEEFDNRLKALEQEKSEALKTVAKLNDEINDLKETAQNDLPVDMDSRSKKQIAELKSSLTDSKQALKIQENLVKTLNSKIADMGMDVRRLTDEGVELRSALSEAKEEKSRLEKKLSEVQARLDQKAQDLAQPSKNDQTKKAPVDIAELQRSAAENQKELKTKEDLIKTLNAKIADLGIDVNRLTDEGAELRSALTGTKEEKSRLEKELSEVKAKFDEKLRELPKLSEKGKTKKETTDFDRLQRSAAESKKALKVQEDLIKTLNTKIADLGIETRRLTEEGSKLRQSLALANDEKARMEEELGEVKAKLELSAEASLKSSGNIERRSLSLQKERDEIQAKLQKMTQERDELAKQLEASQLKQKTAEDESRDVTQKYEAELSALKEQKNKLDNELTTAAGRAATFEKTIANLNTELEEARNVLLSRDKEGQSVWQEKVEALTGDLKKSKDQSAELERLVKDLQQKNRELNVLLEGSQKSLAEKDKAVADLSAAQKEFSAKTTLFAKEKDAYEVRIKALTQEIAAAQTAHFSEMTTVKSESVQKTADLAKKLADAVGETRAKEETIGQMIARQNSLEQELSDALLAKAQAEASSKQVQAEIDILRKDFELEKGRMKDEVLRFGNQRDEQIIKVNELQNALKDAEKQSKLAVSESREPLIKEIENLKGQLQKNEIEFLTVQAANKQLDQTKEDLIKQLAASQLKQKDIQAKFDEWKNAISQKENQNRGAVANVEKELNTKIADISAQLKESNRKADELTKLKADLEKKIKDQESRISRLDEDLAQKNNELLAQRNRTTEEFSAKQKDLQAQLEKLTQERNGSKNSIVELTKAKETLEGDLKAREVKVAQLESELKDKQTTLDAVQDQSASDLMAAKKTSDAKIQVLTGELAASKDAMTQLTKSKEGLEILLKEAQEKIAVMGKDISERTVEWQKKLSDQEKLLKVSREEVRAPLMKEIEELKKNIESNAVEIETLAKQNKELTETKKALAQQLAEVEAKEKENQIKMAGVQEAMLNKGAQDRQALISMEKDLKATIQEITAKLADSQAQASELSKAKDKLDQDLKVKADAIAKLEVEAIERQNSLSVVEAKAKEEIAVSKKLFDNQIAQLNAKIKNYEGIILDLTRSKESVQEDLKSKESRIVQLEKESSDKGKALETLKTQSSKDVDSAKQALSVRIEEISAEKKEAEAQALKLTGDLQAARKSIDDLIKARESLENSLESKETQIAGLQAQISEKDKAVSILKAQSSDELTALQNKLNDQIEKLSSELKSEREALGALTKTKEGLEAALKTSEAKLVAVNSELAKKDEAIKAIEANVTSRITTAKKPLEDKIDILVKSLGDVQTEIKTKQGTIEGLNTKVSGLEKSLSETSAAKANSEKESAQAKAALEQTRKNTAAEIQKANKPLLEKNQMLQVEVEESDKKIASLVAERDRLSQESAKLTADGRKLQQDVTLLKQEIENQKRVLAENAAVVKAPLLAEINDLKKALDDKERLIEQKAEAFAKVNEELATVLKGLAVIREDRDKMSAMVKPLQEQIKGIPQEVALAKAPLEQENSRLKVELEKVQGMLDVRVQGLEADLVKRTSDFEKAENERRAMEKEIARVSQSNEELTQDMEKLQLKLSKKFQEDCGVALEEIQKPWKDKIDQLKAQLEGRDKEIESFKNENLRLNQELGSLSEAAQ